MIPKLRNNKRLLRRDSMFDSDSFFVVHKETLVPHYDRVLAQYASSKQLKAIRAKAKWHLLRYKSTAVFLVILMVSFFAILIYKMINPTMEPRLTQSHILEETRKDNRYLFFITSGDEWLAKEHWHNAIFQYKKALEIRAGDYDGLYRLAVAYIHRCQDTRVNCEEGMEILDRLEAFSPNDQELRALRLALGTMYED